MTNNEPQFPRDEKHFCQKCGQHLALCPKQECKADRYNERYKPADQGRRDHRRLDDYWAAMKESDKR